MGRLFLLACRGTICLIGIAFLLSLISSTLTAQPTNLERLRLDAAALADSTIGSRTSGDTICVSVVAHPAAWLVEQTMLERAERQGVIVRTCDDPRHLHQLSITGITIEYVPVDDAALLERRTLVSVAAILPTRGSDPTLSPSRVTRSFTVSSTDTVEADRITTLESSGYEFTRGVSTAAQPGFWEKVIEPAVVLGASAVMIILLFTVRSN